MIYLTEKLKKLVHPDNLEDILDLLKKEGIIKYYIILDDITTIQMNKGVDIRLLFEEETKAITNPHPYVKNKRNK